MNQNKKTKKSLVDELEDGIAKADEYKKYIDSELQPLIDEKRSRIIEIDTDIKIKQGDIDALLSDATANSLVQGYLESKAEYTNGIAKEYKQFKADNWMIAFVNEWRTLLFNLGVFLHNLARHLPNVFNYILFIAPLISIVFIFTNQELAEIVINSLSVDSASDTNRIAVERYSPKPQ